MTASTTAGIDGIAIICYSAVATAVALLATYALIMTHVLAACLFWTLMFGNTLAAWFLVLPAVTTDATVDATFVSANVLATRPATFVGRALLDHLILVLARWS